MHLLPKCQRFAAPLLPLVLFAACGEAPAPAWRGYPGLATNSSARDTSVLDSPSPGWRAGEGWTVSPEPVLRIGVTEGPPEYQLYRVAGVLRADDGRVLVADGASKQIRIFSPDGRHLRSVGGDGEGPGEFRDIQWMESEAADSVTVWDLALARGTRLTARGEFVRSLAVPPVPDYPLLVPEGAFADGSILAQAGPPREETDGAGRRWKVVGVYRVAPDAGPEGAQLLGEFPSQRVADPVCEDQEDCDAAKGEVWATWRAAGDRLLYSRGDVPEVLVLDAADGSLRVLRQGEDRSGAAAEGEPFFDELHADDQGHVWARRHGSGRWSVFDPGGRWLGEVELPGGLDVYQIADGYIAGVERSELGVEQVVLYRLAAAK